MPVSHPEVNSYVEDGFLLLGGGFEVLDQDRDGNIATASFPFSTFSWMARSRDRNIPLHDLEFLLSELVLIL
jgi:hypothetical protein